MSRLSCFGNSARRAISRESKSGYPTRLHLE
jgi:hypothetical protein